jgi:pimeloyl-ACP methyl ester carboxylesterase
MPIILLLIILIFVLPWLPTYCSLLFPDIPSFDQTSNPYARSRGFSEEVVYATANRGDHGGRQGLEWLIQSEGAIIPTKELPSLIGNRHQAPSQVIVLVHGYAVPPEYFGSYFDVLITHITEGASENRLIVAFHWPAASAHSGQWTRMLISAWQGLDDLQWENISYRKALASAMGSSSDALAELLATVHKQTGAKSISIITHSMGAVLTLSALIKVGTGVPIDDLILLAPYLKDDALEDTAVQSAIRRANKVHVAYSSNDGVLAWSGRKLGTQGPSAKGAMPNNVMLHDVTVQIKGHSSYLQSESLEKMALGTLLTRHGSRSQDLTTAALNSTTPAQADLSWKEDALRCRVSVAHNNVILSLSAAFGGLLVDASGESMPQELSVLAKDGSIYLRTNVAREKRKLAPLRSGNGSTYGLRVEVGTLRGATWVELSDDTDRIIVPQLPLPGIEKALNFLRRCGHEILSRIPRDLSGTWAADQRACEPPKGEPRDGIVLHIGATHFSWGGYTCQVTAIREGTLNTLKLEGQCEKGGMHGVGRIDILRLGLLLPSFHEQIDARIATTGFPGAGEEQKRLWWCKNTAGPLDRLTDRK